VLLGSSFIVVNMEAYMVVNMIALEAYMVVNFRARGISRGTCKLVQTPTLIKKKKILKSSKSLPSHIVD